MTRRIARIYARFNGVTILTSRTAHPSKPGLFRLQADSGARLCPHFSVEIETGTGKTYVSLTLTRSSGSLAIYTPATISNSL
jgi:hypothetical protein